ncbi:MAG: SUMF1/EgtB/PvdO family nonheme iron enzyme [Candidatus Latescibacterota bacterium]
MLTPGAVGVYHVQAQIMGTQHTEVFEVTVVPGSVPPVARILAIAGPGTVTYEGQLVSFSGSGLDGLGGALPASSLAWSSSIDGPLGQGAQLSRPLSAGQHTITLRVTDSRGQTGTASTTFAVSTVGRGASVVRGQLALPDGIDPTQTTVLSGLEETTPTPAGAFFVSPPEIHRLTMVLDHEGNTLLLSLLPPAEPTPRADSQTTATALVFFATHLYTAPPALWSEAITLIEQTPAVEDLARVLEGRLQTTATVLTAPDAQTQAALAQAVLAVDDQLGRLAGTGKVTPSGPLSQVRVVHPAEGQGEAVLEVRNFGRRYLSIWVDQTLPVSRAVAEGSIVGPAGEPVSFATLGSYLSANRDPAGVLSPATRQLIVPLAAGLSNVYQVDVVGAAFRGGVPARGDAYWVTWGFTFGDFVLLKLLKVLVGVDLPDGSAMAQWQEWADLTNKVVTGIRASAEFRDALSQGSVWGILDACTKIMTEHDALAAIVGVANRALARHLGVVSLGKTLAAVNPWIQGLKLASAATDYGFIGYSLLSDNPQEQFIVDAAGGNATPTVTISAPPDKSTFRQHTSIVLSGSATDLEGGALAGTSLSWTSSLDGPLGSGNAVTVSSLRSGTHTITLTATDSKGASATASLTVVITAAPTASRSLVFVLDLSGSMNDLPSAGGPQRLEVAKEALAEVLAAAPATGAQEYALVTFGGSCTVDTPVPFTTDPQGVAAYVQGLTADGSTPLGEALRTAQHLALDQASSDDVQLVLLSDGQETCNGDPLAVAQAIAAGRRAKPLARLIRLNAIGLGVTPGEADEQQIQAIAAAAGGNYYRVSEPQDLAAALGQASGLQTATATLTGKVTDSQDRAVSGASVRLLNHLDLREQTDANGNYQFPASFQGVDSLIVEAVGYVRHATEVYVSGRSYDVRLQPSAAMLPVAVATAEPASVESGQTVTLRGGGSSDPSGSALVYHWEQSSSNPFPVSLSPNDSETAFATRLTLADLGTYRFILVVENRQGLRSAPDTVAVQVRRPDLVANLPGGATMDFVWIAPGTFMMGSPSSESGRGSNEGPQHEVTLTQGYWLGKYEITQGQWQGVLGTTPWAGRSYVQSNASHPAVYISWNEVQGLVHALNESSGDSLYRLPTEAEWEYACRAGTTTLWSFGDDESQLWDYAWYDANAESVGKYYGQPVGTRQGNPWGLHDMHGNVWEWVQDWYGDYGSGAVTDPAGPSTGSARVMRGGFFGSPARATRSAIRTWATPDDRREGARLLRTR